MIEPGEDASTVPHESDGVFLSAYMYNVNT
jgi:hypothetical protein